MLFLRRERKRNKWKNRRKNSSPNCPTQCIKAPNYIQENIQKQCHIMCECVSVQSFYSTKKEIFVLHFIVKRMALVDATKISLLVQLAVHAPCPEDAGNCCAGT